MAFGAGAAPLAPNSRTLSPLPGYHRDGLKAVTIFGTISFVSTTILFVYLSFKLARWQFSSGGRSANPAAHDNDSPPSSHHTSDLTLGLDQKNFGRVKFSPVRIRQEEDNSNNNNNNNNLFTTLGSAAEHPEAPGQRGPGQQQKAGISTTTPNSSTAATGATNQNKRRQLQKRRRRRPNQFLILVYNLLLADMHQAAAFMLNARWVADNEILVGTRLCWTQGWFVSNGDLSASLFATAIAAHTYLSVVRGWRPPDWALYLTISSIWVFVYAMGVVGVVATRNGRDQGGFYVRAVSWCWVNDYYENYRFWLHYFWIFLSLILTSALYILIFFSLQRRCRREQTNSSHHYQQHHRRISSSVVTGSRTSRTTSHDQDRAAIMRSEDEDEEERERDDAVDHRVHPTTVSGRHPAFLVYPLIYVVCTAPLALGRVVGMLGGHASVSYFCAAGALIASNGWLDVVLFSVTRRSLLFHADAGHDDAGLDTFTFMRTPRERKYGNMVWVQGGGPPRTLPSGAAAGQGDVIAYEDGTGQAVLHTRGGSGAGLGRGQRKNGGWGWERIGERIGWVGGLNSIAAGVPSNPSPALISNRQRGDSQTSLQSGGHWGLSSNPEQGIQMDIVTSVVVEIDKPPSSRRPSDGSSMTRFGSHGDSGHVRRGDDHGDSQDDQELAPNS